MKGFMEQFAISEFLAALNTMTPIEEDWASSTFDLYVFAVSNASYITVDKGRIIISDGSIRELFNIKLKPAEKLRNDFVVASNNAGKATISGLKQ